MQLKIDEILFSMVKIQVENANIKEMLTNAMAENDKLKKEIEILKQPKDGN